MIKIDLLNSKIIECKINNIVLDRNNYSSICKFIWSLMTTEKILQNTTFNFKLQNVNGEKGFNWCEEIKMSVQNKDANSTIKEIIKMVHLNNLQFEIAIKLKSDNVIYYKDDCQ